MPPSSREKINGHHFVGNLIGGIIVAAVLDSWLIGVIVMVGLTVASLHTGDIRLSSTRKR